MHEIGVMNGILEAACDAAKNAGMARITEIRVTIGELTEVMEPALEFAFEALKPGTMAENATLVITKVSPRSRCKVCGHEYEHGRFAISCPKCDSFMVELLQGRELRIDSIEAEDDSTDDAPAGE
ncbi:MAG: hydrogenase maturation nickel metallochaperone HypA [Coriobacteriia bacterium]